MTNRFVLAETITPHPHALLQGACVFPQLTFLA